MKPHEVLLAKTRLLQALITWHLRVMCLQFGNLFTIECLSGVKCRVWRVVVCCFSKQIAHDIFISNTHGFPWHAFISIKSLLHALQLIKYSAASESDLYNLSKTIKRDTNQHTTHITIDIDMSAGQPCSPSAHKVRNDAHITVAEVTWLAEF